MMTYSIQQVAKMTGLSKQVIRKWEDRYGIISPERLENGYRIYREDEVTLLKEIIALTNAGHSVKQAAILVKQKGAKTRAKEKNPLLESLIKAGQTANEMAIQQILDKAQYQYGLAVLIDELIEPFLSQIHRLSYEKIWDDYQVTISYQIVRDFLATIRRRYPIDNYAPFIIGSCLPNEHNEIPVQLFLLRAMLLGYQTKMLGASPSRYAIETAAQLNHPKLMFIYGRVLENNLAQLKKLDTLAQTLPQTTFYLFVEGSNLAPLNLNSLKPVQSTKDIFASLPQNKS
ncbi:MerR family transcriptional regulator [Metabacillus malikii]|nr:MerR family transcriptional regulator [Metabacillus malikii]